MPAASCSELSRSAGEALAGTSTCADRWLLVEQRGVWGRDAVADTGFTERMREALEGFPGRVLLVRRPGRRQRTTVMVAVATEEGGEVRRLELESPVELPGADLQTGDPVTGQVLLVCAHGRRDACCARLGSALFEALAAHVDPALLWQSSHQGGHRFAANLLALPSGVQLGRVEPTEAERVAAAVRTGRIPLERYRGRTLYEPAVQAAEVAVRHRLGLDALADLRLRMHDRDLIRFAVPGGEAVVRVTAVPGPVLPASCGAVAEPTQSWRTRIESTP